MRASSVRPKSISTECALAEQRYWLTYWPTQIIGKVCCVENGLEPHRAAGLKAASEEVANEFGVLFNDTKSVIFDPISERDCCRPSKWPSFSEAADWTPPITASPGAARLNGQRSCGCARMRDDLFPVPQVRIGADL